jgi:hypothetical protein
MIKNKCKKYRVYVSSSLLLLLLLFLVFVNNVCAHSPSGLDLNYDVDTQKLNVTISHQVADPDSHYIYGIEIKKNGEVINNYNYNEQPITASFTYTYDVNATNGDVIEVKTLCNQGGSRTKQLTVGSEDSSSTPGFELFLLIFAFFVLFVFKKAKN